MGSRSLITLLFCSSTVVTALSTTHEGILGNGLKVVVRTDHRSPVGTVQVWYKVGSACEHNVITGISHMLEHMMFKGTKHYPKFEELVVKHGGEHNAFTMQDATVYYENIGIA